MVVMENYELVQKGFRILHPAMSAYIGQEFVRVYGEGSSGVILSVLQDQSDLPQTGYLKKLIESLDLMNCFRLIDRCWKDVFGIKLSRNCRSLAKLLIDFRNKAAHIGNKDFEQIDAERALDYMAQLCHEFDTESEEEIRKLYRKLRFGSEDGSLAAPAPAAPAAATKKNEGVMRGAFGLNLPSWRDVMRPHPDVSEGRYRNAEFAADLAQVARGQGAVEYRDPVEFFGRTYVTEGMSGLLTESLRRLAGQGGEPVIQLKTAFGGGKTHTMLALYHLARKGLPIGRIPNLKPILERAGLAAPPSANVAVLVGTSLDPAHAKNPPNLPNYKVNTIWGEMAFQLVTSAGKPKLYSLVADSDRRGTSPGSETLKNLFDQCGPCLVLMDELVAYAKKIYGVEGLPAGSFDNFITFIQEVSEAARASKNSMVVASIPESEIEIGGEAGQQALEAIEHTFGRMESVWKPVGANEGFEVVRRRLFLDCADPAARERVCNAFSSMYLENAADFPPEAKEVDYRDRMIACYPIHPEVFDRLYDDWATLERFQRTRGVLRLMAAVIHELWMGNDSGAMIMPGSIPLNTPNLREELVRYLPVPEIWSGIIDREVDGRNSVPYQVDNATPRYGQKLAARRVARTVMMGSAPSSAALRGQSVRGLETPRIRLGVVQPGESIADFNDALNSLHDSLSNLYSDQNRRRFWYDTKPTLRKTAEDRASQYSDADVTTEIEARLKKLRKEEPFSGLHVCPSSSNDIPDEQMARLVILRPEDSFRRSGGEDNGNALETVVKYLNTRGTSPRVYRNVLAFVAPDREKLRDLNAEAKRYLAWQSIVKDKDLLNLDGGQVREAENALKRSHDAVESKIRETYCWLMIPGIDPYTDLKALKWEIVDLGGGDAGIVSKAAKKMKQDEQVITEWAPALLKMCLDDPLWKDSDNIQVKKLWQDLCAYCYLPRLASYKVLEDAIIKGASSREFFGIAAGFADGRYIDLKLNESISSLNQSDLLVKPDVAAKQIEAERKPAVSDEPGAADGAPPEAGSGGSGAEGQGGQPRPGGAPDPAGGDGAPVPRKKTRFFMCVKLDYTHVHKNIRDYVDNIVQPLQRVDGNEMELRFEISVTTPKGFPPSIVRTVTENCHALKIEESGEFSFEEE